MHTEHSSTSCLSFDDDQALDWFVRRASGLDASEESRFQTWLAADPAHPVAFARWQAEWDDLDTLPAASVDRLRRKLAVPVGLALHLDADQPDPRQSLAHAPIGHSRPRTPPARGASASSALRAWLTQRSHIAPRVAFCSAVVLTALGGGLFWEHWQQPVFTAQYASARGEQFEVTLPDGSRLKLDSLTEVEVAFHRKRRQVRLIDGQAVFDVAPDVTLPFDVLAANTRVTVVGTRFAVRNTPAIAGHDTVRVAVEEGRVRVRRNQPLLVELARAVVGPSHQVELHAGEQLAADAAGLPGPVSAIPPIGIAPWQERRVSFNDVPLSQALAEFERYGDPRIVASNPAVAALRITGTFDPTHLDGFTRVLPKILPVRLQRHDGITEIVPVR